MSGFRYVHRPYVESLSLLESLSMYAAYPLKAGGRMSPAADARPWARGRILPASVGPPPAVRRAEG